MTDSAVTEELTSFIRQRVRAQKPYLVPGSQIEPDIKLNQNESPFDLPAELKQKLAQTFLDTPFNRYPKEHPYKLRDALAEYLNHPAEGILIGNGSNEITYTLGLCLIEKDVPVVLPAPMFSLYTSVVNLHGGTLIKVAPKEDLHFDVDAICNAIEQHRPSLTVIATPNNPTGLAISLDQVKRIAQTSPGFVLVDEAYVEFIDDDNALSILSEFPNMLILRTFSKAFGLAGLRIGYLLGHPEIINQFMKSRLPFMIDRMTETVALTLLKEGKLIADRIQFMKDSCRQLTDALEKMPDVSVISSKTNFVIFKTPHSTDLMMKNLVERGVLVRNMSGYPELAGYLRVNAGSESENKAFLNALKATL